MKGGAEGQTQVGLTPTTPTSAFSTEVAKRQFTQWAETEMAEDMGR